MAGAVLRVAGSNAGPFTCRFRPLDECHAALAEVTPSDVAGSLTLPTGRNRRLFTTHGLGNLGLPEVWIDDVAARADVGRGAARRPRRRRVTSRGTGAAGW